jgi:iron complex transport system ATP-binding protein
LLDEPVTFLDVQHELEILTLVQTLSRKYGITVGWVLHNLNNAASYSDHMIMIKKGEVYAKGKPERVMTRENIHEVFGVDVTIIKDPENGGPICLPKRPQMELLG